MSSFLFLGGIPRLPFTLGVVNLSYDSTRETAGANARGAKRLRRGRNVHGEAFGMKTGYSHSVLLLLKYSIPRRRDWETEVLRDGVLFRYFCQILSRLNLTALLLPPNPFLLFHLGHIRLTVYHTTSHITHWIEISKLFYVNTNTYLSHYFSSTLTIFGYFMQEDC